MDLIYQYYRLMPGTLDEVEDMWEMVKSILTNMMIDWKKPDKGIWEIRGEGQHFVSSQVMCWVALDRGARIADLLNKPTYRRRWSEEATVIKENVMKNGWKEEMQSFSQAYGNSDLDASLLLMEPYGFIDPRDMRYHKTVPKIAKREICQSSSIDNNSSKSPFIMYGKHWRILSIGQSHHFNISNRFITSVSKRFRISLAGVPPTIV